MTRVGLPGAVAAAAIMTLSMSCTCPASCDPLEPGTYEFGAEQVDGDCARTIGGPGGPPVVIEPGYSELYALGTGDGASCTGSLDAGACCATFDRTCTSTAGGVTETSRFQGFTRVLSPTDAELEFTWTIEGRCEGHYRGTLVRVGP